MMKSIVDLGDDLACGRLERVLPLWSGGDMPIVALFASRHHQPRKVRAFLDAMAAAMRRQGDAVSSSPARSPGSPASGRSPRDA